MARLLRQRIKELEEKNQEFQEELSEWYKVGDVILKFYHYKKISDLLKQTKYFILMAGYKGKQAEDEMHREFDKQFFGG